MEGKVATFLRNGWQLSPEYASALEAYNTNSRNVAAAIGSQTLKKPNVRNYLEQRATELGIGIQARLSNYGEIANAREPRQTVQRRYGKDKEGHLVLVSMNVTVFCQLFYPTVLTSCLPL